MQRPDASDVTARNGNRFVANNGNLRYICHYTVYAHTFCATKYIEIYLFTVYNGDNLPIRIIYHFTIYNGDNLPIH